MYPKKRYTMLILASLLAGLLLLLGKHKKKDFHLDYSPPLAPPQTLEKTPIDKVAEYEQIIAGKDPKKLKHQTKRARFGLAKLLQKKEPKETDTACIPTPKETPPNKPRRSTQPATYFYTYTASPPPREANKKQARENLYFFQAILYKKQQVAHGEAVVLQLKEPCHSPKLPKGTLLFGAAQFAHHRILLTLSMAQYQGKNIPVHMTCYDTDFLPGLYVKGIAPVLEKAQHKLLQKAMTATQSTPVREVSRSAIEAIKEWKKKKTVTLPHKKVVFVKNNKE